MKKILYSIVLIAVLVFTLSACDKKKAGETSGDGEDQSWQYIQDKGELIMGLDDSFPPMGFRDDEDNIVGFDIDLAQAVCDNLGIELVLQPIAWTAKEQEIKTKTIDCIWNGFSVTKERLEEQTMSKPYMKNTIALVVVGDSGIETLDDMAGKKIALQSGSSAEETLDLDSSKDFKDSLDGINPFADYVTALMDLETGNSDAVLMDSVVAKYMIEEVGKDFVVLDDALVAEDYAVGFRKGDIALSEAVEKAMSELKADGTVEQIAIKWFGEDITTIE